MIGAPYPAVKMNACPCLPGRAVGPVLPGLKIAIDFGSGWEAC